MIKTTPRITKWQNAHYTMVNGKSMKNVFYAVDGGEYDTIDDAIATAVNLEIPIRHATDYNISYDGDLYAMRDLTKPTMNVKETKFVNFKYIIRKAYDEINFKCSNLNSIEQEFIDAIHAMKVEDKLTS